MKNILDLKDNLIVTLKNNYKIIIFCLLISTVILFFTTLSSPLYPFHLANDVNIYFTIGKGWLEGYIPYVDLFDQKGPLIYFAFMIIAAISKTSFIGLYLFEIILFTIFLFYIHKIINLFVDKKFDLLIIPFFAVFVCTSFPFFTGGTVEELLLPCLTVSLYYLCYYFKGNSLTKKQYFINGLMAGIVFMIKFNLLAFWFGFMLFIFIDLIMKKDIKMAFKNSFIFLAGMFLPFLIFTIYFLIVGGIYDFFYGYFYFNLFAYPNDLSILDKFNNSLINFFNRMIEAKVLTLFIFILSLSFIRNSGIQKKYKIMFYLIIILTIFGVYFGSNYHYYLLFLYPFLIFGIIDVFRCFQKYFKKVFTSKLFIVILILYYLCLVFIAYDKANYKSMMGKSISDLGINEIINEINSSDDKSLLNYGFLDNGLYFLTNTIPTEKYYFKLNVSEEKFPELYNSQRKCIENQCVNYVLVTNVSDDDPVYKYLEGNYEKIITNDFVTQDFEGNETSKEFALYKVQS